MEEGAFSHHEMS